MAGIVKAATWCLNRGGLTLAVQGHPRPIGAPRGIASDPRRIRPKKMVVPVVAWLVVAALVGAFIRYLVRVRVQAAPAAAGRGARQSVWAVVPTVALLPVGGGLLAAPLGLARHFYPDGGWAATVAAWTAVTWSAVRLAVGIASGVRTRRSTPIPNAAARADGRTPERATAGT